MTRHETSCRIPGERAQGRHSHADLLARGDVEADGVQHQTKLLPVASADVPELNHTARGPATWRHLELARRLVKLCVLVLLVGLFDRNVGVVFDALNPCGVVPKRPSM